MTQRGFPFSCGCGDGTVVTHQDWQLLNDLLAFRDRTAQGPIWTTHPTYSGRLAATNPAGNTVRIASGAALIAGALYLNTANVDFDVTGPGGGAQTDLIVIQYTFAACAPRLVHKQGVPGGAAATVTQTALVWEIPLCQVYKAGGIVITSITDLREYVNAREKTLFIPAYTNSLNGPTTYMEQLGAKMADGVEDEVWGHSWIPDDYLGFVSLYAVVVPDGSGNVYITSNASAYGLCGEAYNTNNANAGAPAAIAVTNAQRNCIADITTFGALAVPGQGISMKMIRDASNALDTIGSSVWVQGWVLRYLGSTV